VSACILRKKLAIITAQATNIKVLVSDHGDIENIRPKTNKIWKNGKFDTVIKYIIPIVIP
jgi:hypothetical protein